MDTNEVIRKLEDCSWSKLNKIIKEDTSEGIIHHEDEMDTDIYSVNVEKLAEEDKKTYGITFKEDVSCVELCSNCSMLINPSAMDTHFEQRHKHSEYDDVSPVKIVSSVSPTKKKNSRSKSRNSHDEEQERRSLPSTPSTPSSVNYSDVVKETLDKFPLIQIPIINSPSDDTLGGDSKPPTPGPEDLYEDFAVPTTSDINACSSLSSYSTNKNMDISENHVIFQSSELSTIPTNQIIDEPVSNVSQKGNRTISLLEAQLMAKPKINYNKSAHSKYKPLFTSSVQHPSYGQNTVSSSSSDISTNLNTFVPTSMKHKPTVTTVNNFLQSNASLVSQNSLTRRKPQNETRISLPISMIPDSLKLSVSRKTDIQSLNKNNVPDTLPDSEINDRFINILSSAKSVSTSSSIEYTASSVSTISSSGSEPTLSPKPKKYKPTRGRPKDPIIYDPDKHCGVIVERTGKNCLHFLSCKSHTVASKRAVQGRTKTYDMLLADHRSNKDIGKQLYAVKDIPDSKDTTTTQATPCSYSSDIVQFAALNSAKEKQESPPQDIQVNGNTINISNADSKCVLNDENHLLPSFNLLKPVAPNNTSDSNVSQSPPPQPVKSTLPKVTVTVQDNTTAESTEKKIPIINVPITDTVVVDTKNKIAASLMMRSRMLVKVGGILCSDRNKLSIRNSLEELINRVVKVDNVPQSNILQQSNRNTQNLMNVLNPSVKIKEEVKRNQVLKMKRASKIKNKLSKVIKTNRRELRLKYLSNLTDENISIENLLNPNVLGFTAMRKRMPEEYYNCDIEGFITGSEAKRFKLDMEVDVNIISNSGINVEDYDYNGNNSSLDEFSTDVDCDKNAFDYLIDEENVVSENSPFLCIPSDVSLLDIINEKSNDNRNNIRPSTDDFFNDLNNIQNVIPNFGLSDITYSMILNSGSNAYASLNAFDISENELLQALNNATTYDNFALNQNFQTSDNSYQTDSSQLPDIHYDTNNSKLRENITSENEESSFDNAEKKDFELLEEYVKNMSCDDKNNLSDIFGSGDLGIPAIPTPISNLDQKIVANDNSYTLVNQVQNNSADMVCDQTANEDNADTYAFETQLITSYLANIASSQANNTTDTYQQQNIENIFDDLEQPSQQIKILENITQSDAPQLDSYEFLPFNASNLAGNDNIAASSEKPATPGSNFVCETDEENPLESLQWF